MEDTIMKKKVRATKADLLGKIAELEELVMDINGENFGLRTALVRIGAKSGYSLPPPAEQRLVVGWAGKVSDHVIEELQNAKGPMEKAVALAEELTKDLAYSRSMWRTEVDAEKLLVAYWRGLFERMVESRATKNSTGVEEEMRRPSQRDLGEKTREAVLEEVARGIQDGRIQVGEWEVVGESGPDAKAFVMKLKVEQKK